MILTRLNNEHKIKKLLILFFLDLLYIIEWPNMLQALDGGPLLPGHQCDIVYFLLGYCFGVQEIEAVKINVAIGVIVLVYFVKDLPGNIIIDLLLHLLKLFKSNLFLRVLLVAAILVLFVNFMLKILSHLLILLDDFLSLVIDLSLCEFYGSLGAWLDHVASAVLTKLGRQISIGPYNIWCPEYGRFHIDFIHLHAGSQLLFLELLLALLLSKIDLPHSLPLFVEILLRLHTGHVTFVILGAVNCTAEIKGVLWDLLHGFLNILDARDVTS